MSRTFEKLLNGLQDIRSEKLCELDGLFGAHQSWLTEIVENVQGRIEAFRGPPGKRRRVDARALEKLKHILGAESDVVSSGNKVGLGTGLPTVLETVAEEEEERMSDPGRMETLAEEEEERMSDPGRMETLAEKEEEERMSDPERMDAEKEICREEGKGPDAENHAPNEMVEDQAASPPKAAKGRGVRRGRNKKPPSSCVTKKKSIKEESKTIEETKPPAEESQKAHEEAFRKPARVTRASARKRKVSEDHDMPDEMSNSLPAIDEIALKQTAATKKEATSKHAKGQKKTAQKGKGRGAAKTTRKKKKEDTPVTKEEDVVGQQKQSLSVKENVGEEAGEKEDKLSHPEGLGIVQEERVIQSPEARGVEMAPEQIMNEHQIKETIEDTLDEQEPAILTKSAKTNDREETVQEDDVVLRRGHTEDEDTGELSSPKAEQTSNENKVEKQEAEAEQDIDEKVDKLHNNKGQYDDVTRTFDREEDAKLVSDERLQIKEPNCPSSDLSPKASVESDGSEYHEAEEDWPRAELAVEDLPHARPAEEDLPQVPPTEDQTSSAQPEEKKGGFAANLVSSLKTFLPSKSEPQSPEANARKAKIKALEAANAAKKKEEEKAAEKAKQKAELERIRQERLQAKAEAEKEEARRKEELQRKKEQEAAARRKAREEAERREREEKAKRLEEHKKRRKLEAEAAARGTGSSQGNQTSSGSKSLAAAKERLAKIQQQAAMLKKQPPSNSGDDPKPPTAQFKPEGTKAPSNAAPSYEISPYKSDFESDDDGPKKPVPDWARGKALLGQLMAQMHIDPDEVFQQHAKTCSLDDVFASCRKSGSEDYNRRTSSGNWIEDRVTWKEEFSYKKAMGYI